MEGILSMGHARALLGAGTKAQQNAIWRAVVSKGLSVRETERLVKRLKTEKETPKKTPINSDLLYFTKVSIRRRGQKGRVEIEFYTDDDLNRLLNLLKPT